MTTFSLENELHISIGICKFINLICFIKYNQTETLSGYEAQLHFNFTQINMCITTTLNCHPITEKFQNIIVIAQRSNK